MDVIMYYGGEFNEMYVQIHDILMIILNLVTFDNSIMIISQNIFEFIYFPRDI
jgi:hypothetical protein